MATIEERLTALEQEHADLKEKMELQTIAIGGLVNKATLEKINEKNEKISQALITHDEFTNHQLAELREKLEEVEGKIVGVQTEMRYSIAGVQTEMRYSFEQQGQQIAGLRGDVSTQGQKLDQVLLLLTALAPKPDQEA